MTLIHVPRPPKSAFDPNRPVSGLLKAQMEHLHQAASKLPLRYRSEVYVNAIKTEGEAGRYIREVTEAIHSAHRDAAAARVRVVPKRRRGIEIAAVADEGAERKLWLKAKKRGAKKIGAKKTGKKPARKT
jgi:hypothetical protein